MKTYEKIYNLVKKIPKGRVMTYGQIGQILDLNPRVVGWALNRLAKYRVTSLRGGSERVDVAISKRYKIASSQLKVAPRNDVTIPWQRVINSKGGISTNKLMNIPLDLQKKLLQKEGVKFSKDEKIDLKEYLWKV